MSSSPFRDAVQQWQRVSEREEEDFSRENFPAMSSKNIAESFLREVRSVLHSVSEREEEDFSRENLTAKLREPYSAAVQQCQRVSEREGKDFSRENFPAEMRRPFFDAVQLRQRVSEREGEDFSRENVPAMSTGDLRPQKKRRIASEREEILVPKNCQAETDLRRPMRELEQVRGIGYFEPELSSRFSRGDLPLRQRVSEREEEDFFWENLPAFSRISQTFSDNCDRILKNMAGMRRTLRDFQLLIQAIDTSINTLHGGHPTLNPGAHCMDIEKTKKLSKKLRRQITEFQGFDHSGIKCDTIQKLSELIDSQQLRTFCRNMQNAIDKSDAQEMREYGQLTKFLLDQIMDLRDNLEEEPCRLRKKATDRHELKIRCLILEHVKLLENNKSYVEKMSLVKNAFDSIRSDLDKISSHCCPIYGETPRVPVGSLDHNFQSIHNNVANFDRRLNNFNASLDHISPKLFKSCSGIAMRMERAIVERGFTSTCTRLSQAISQQDDNGIIYCGKKAKELCDIFSALKISISKEVYQLKLEHIVKPNAEMNPDLHQFIRQLEVGSQGASSSTAGGDEGSSHENSTLEDQGIGTRHNNPLAGGFPSFLLATAVRGDQNAHESN